ncbi:MAG: hypothetical protein IMF19_15925 [Proteobacteria bacterium]|nr:hypothetical protein [Pseudomonadota bacterium]
MKGRSTGIVISNQKNKIEKYHKSKFTNKRHDYRRDYKYGNGRQYPQVWMACLKLIAFGIAYGAITDVIATKLAL